MIPDPFNLAVGVGFLVGFGAGAELAPHLPRTIVRKVAVMRSRFWGWIVANDARAIAILGLMLAVSVAVAGVFVTAHEDHHATAIGVHFRVCAAKYAREMKTALQARSVARQQLDTARQAVTDADTRLWALATRSLDGGHEVGHRVADEALKSRHHAAAYERHVAQHLQRVQRAHPLPVIPRFQCKP